MDERLTLGSLFSGIGGIELGFEKEGFTTKWCVEYDPYATTILKKRFPKATIHGDITKLDFSSLPRVDVLTGGFPCQDISNAGKRIGIEGSRSGLWKYFRDAISVVRPKFVLIENVAAILSRGLDVVLYDLAEVGYDAEWHCVSASTVGAPHQRDRIFVIAYPNSKRCNNRSDNREERHVQENQDGNLEEDKSERNGYGFRIGTVGANEELAYPNSEGMERSKNTRSTQESRKKTNEQPIRFGKDVADTDSKRQLIGREQYKSRILEENGEEMQRTRDKQTISFKSGSKRTIEAGCWSVEPDVGRVAHGIPNRVDRIKCLGNAVVPQVAQTFAKTIKQWMKK